MKIKELIVERQQARQSIENMAAVLPGDINDYFVRFTDQDKIGFSARQHFGRTPDVDDPNYDPLALPRPSGRPALWFYPLKTYLKHPDLYAGHMSYVWLVKVRPSAWLQRVGQDSKQPPPGKKRVGMLRQDQGVPMAIFFEPAFDVIDRWYEPKALKEKINPKVASTDFNVTDHIDVPQLGKLTITAKSLDSKLIPQFRVDVYTPQGKSIGYFRFIVADYDQSPPSNRFLRWMQSRDRREPYIVAGNVSVNDNYQKKGVARAVYQWVKNLGNDIKPSSTQSTAGKSMWKSFERIPL